LTTAGLVLGLVRDLDLRPTTRATWASSGASPAALPRAGVSPGGYPRQAGPRLCSRLSMEQASPGRSDTAAAYSDALELAEKEL